MLVGIPKLRLQLCIVEFGTWQLSTSTYSVELLQHGKLNLALDLNNMSLAEESLHRCCLTKVELSLSDCDDTLDLTT